MPRPRLLSLTLARFAIATLALTALTLTSCTSNAPSASEQIVTTQKNEHAASDPPLLVYVTSEGVVRMDGVDLLDDAAILARAQSYREQHARGTAIVRSDPSTIHGRTVRVVQILEEAQIASVAIDRMR